MDSLNDNFQFPNFLLLCCSLWISVSGKTYKTDIKRPIKIRKHHVVQSKRTGLQTDVKYTGGQTVGRTFRWTDGQI